jgi:hypothetical protein
MSRKKRRETPGYKWEQALIDDYYDYRWRQVLNPLYEKFKRWEAGELEHWDIDQAIHETHKENQSLYRLFTEKRSVLIGMIQWDEEWFAKWIGDHPPPEGIQLVAQRAGPTSNVDETTPNASVAEMDREPRWTSGISG